MRRVTLVTAIIAIVIAGAAVALVARAWLRTGRPAPGMIVDAMQSDRVRAWAAAQLSAIAGDLLNPTFSMESVTYEYPRTLVARGVRLREGDVDIITADIARIELAKIPREGEPIVFESVRLGTPVVRLIPVPGAGLLGLSDLIRTGGSTLREDGGSTVPSDIFSLRRLEIVDGTLTFEPADAEPMVLDDIDITTDVAPSPLSPGLYALTGRLHRAPIVEIEAQAELEIDEGWLRIVNAVGRANLEATEYHYLPPGLQKLARAHDVEAHLVTTWRGMIPFGNDGLDLDWTLDLTDARAVIGDWHLPIAALDVSGRIDATAYELTALRGRMLGGTVEIDGRFERRGPMRTTLTVDAENLRLEEILHRTGSDKPPYTGAVRLDLDAAADLVDLPASLAGGGTVALADGVTVDDPGLTRLFSLLRLRPWRGETTNHGSARVTFDGDRIDLADLDVVSVSMAVRGAGSVWHDGRLDLLVNAGPMERIQEGLGAVGDLLGAVTDRLLKYQVTGTTAEPEVHVLPLGVGATPTDR